MSSNSFGKLFTMTTFGESHGKAIGVVVDGCPAGVSIDLKMIHQELACRATGKSAYTSARREKDDIEILSGVFEGVSTGAPIAMVIKNHDGDPTKYEPIKDLLRPGHANYSYLEKYGIFDYRGGGRASARETVARVAAGAIAKEFLKKYGITCIAYIKQIKDVVADVADMDLTTLQKNRAKSALFCPDHHAEEQMKEKISDAKEKGDSLGGIVEFQIHGAPAGLGDPIYQKLDARLAFAMMSLPATKGFEIGQGFGAVDMSGSEHNDSFVQKEGKITTEKNDAGGVLGGISSGSLIIGRIAFKPTSSIMKVQQTVNLQGEKEEIKLPEGSRHDPCVAIRAPAIVEAMSVLVMADAILMNRCTKT